MSATLAALRAGIKTILIPERNKKDLEDISPLVKKNLKFIPVKHMDEVVKYAIIDADYKESPDLNASTAKKTNTYKKKGDRKRKV